VQQPTPLDELFKWNDVELYDLTTDSAEVKNLANDRRANAELLATMNGKLQAVIKAEIGKDDGRELPDVAGITWGIDKVDL
jgi:arylsulfatase